MTIENETQVIRRRGVATSEFWLTIAVNVAGILAVVSDVLDPKIGGIMMAISSGLYAISRGFAKK